MKKTMFMLAALCGVCAADTLSWDLLSTSEATNWELGKKLEGYEVRGPAVIQDGVFQLSGTIHWQQGYGVYDIEDITMSKGDVLTFAYTINVQSNGGTPQKDAQAALSLVGTNNTIVTGMGYKFTQTQYGLVTTDATKDCYVIGNNWSGNAVNVSNTSNIAPITAGAITLSGTISWSDTENQFVLDMIQNDGQNKTFNLGTTVDVKQIGLVLDGGSDTVPTISGLTLTYKAVPEPATATLSLLALAGLAARRKRH